MIVDIACEELLLICGGARCNWTKIIDRNELWWINPSLSGFLGFISGAAGYATGLGAFGAKYQDKPWVHGSMTLVTGFVMGTVTFLISLGIGQPTRQDCYNCIPILDNETKE